MKETEEWKQVEHCLQRKGKAAAVSLYNTCLAVCSNNKERTETLYITMREKGYITRQEAAELGNLQYFVNALCPRGHRAPRFVSTGSCIECNKEKAREQRAVRKATRDAIRIKKPPKATLQIYTYTEDHETIREFAESLKAAREI